MAVAGSNMCYAAKNNMEVYSTKYQYMGHSDIEYFEMPGKDHAHYCIGMRGADVRAGVVKVDFEVYLRHPKGKGKYEYFSILDTYMDYENVSYSGRYTGIRNKYYDSARTSFYVDGKEYYNSERNSEYK